VEGVKILLSAKEDLNSSSQRREVGRGKMLGAE
jgi:hypothetical protein